MNCKYKKIRTKKGIKYGYCSLLNAEVELFNCKCDKQEIRHFTHLKSNISNQKKKPLKSAKISKLERNRYSILTNNLNVCIECGNRKDHLHEIYFGNNRINSLIYGCVIPLCNSCHIKIHNNITMDLKYKRMCQLKFIKVYKDVDFLNTFHKNYL